MRNKITTQFKCENFPQIRQVPEGSLFRFKAGTEIYMKIGTVRNAIGSAIPAIVQLSTGTVYYPNKCKEVVIHKTPVTISPPREC